MIEYIQQSFLDGMNRRIDPTRISSREYLLLVNGRNRQDAIEPVKLPVELSIPTGKKQGLYGIGSFLLVFVDGYCYQKNFNIPNDIFQPISGFLMSAEVDQIYLETVPAAQTKYRRELALTTAGSGAATKLVNNALTPQFRFDISSQNFGVAAAVVQDGVSQPRLIFPNGTTRVAQPFVSWHKDPSDINDPGREYVPVGKQMLYHNGILYIVSSDGSQIFHSVTGRPLDFVIPVKADGDKVSGSELLGGAPATSHTVDFDPITCIAKISDTGGGFYVATAFNSWIVRPVLDFPIFNEPQFTNNYLFPYGTLNQFSVADVNGDFALISIGGIHSFNVTRQLYQNSSNLPFSADIFDLFDGIVQDVTAAKNFENYAFFGVNTSFGRGILVRDNLSSKFVALDIYPGVGQIRQFAEVRTLTTRKFFAMDTNNKVFELFASSNVDCQLFIGEWSSGNPIIEQTPRQLSVVLSDSESVGTLTATAYVDRQKQTEITKDVLQTTSTLGTGIPFGQTDADQVQNFTFDFARARNGWKMGYMLRWTAKATLTHFRATSQDVKMAGAGLEQQAKEYAKNS